MLFRNPNVNLESNFVGNHNIVENEMNIDVNMGAASTMPMGEGCGHNHMPMPTSVQADMGAACQEPVKQKCIHRTFVHEVPHVCPCHTKVINHHVYKHTYKPAYSCSEENVVSNVQCGSCNQFR